MPSVFPDIPQLVIAHRGLALGIPENTLTAFQLAVEHGADALETDVHVSKDGVAVLSHDPDLSRLTGQPERINQFTASELAATDLGGETVPTLLEFLDAFPNHPVSVDVKEEAAIEPTIKAIRQARAEDRVLLASFSNDRLATLRRALPHSPVVSNARHIIPAYLWSRAGLTSRVTGAVRRIAAVFMPPRARGVSLMEPRFLTHLRDAGVVTGVWTINKPDQMADYWRRGVRAVLTDRTDLAVATRATLAG